jgi:hypothetical protein
LLEKLQPLRKYAGKPRADAVLNKAQSALNRVDAEIGPLIAEVEIAEAVTLVTSPLSALSGAIQSQNISLAQRAKERLLSASEILRGKYATHPIGKSNLDRVDAEIARCDAELGDQMAEERVRSLNTQVGRGERDKEREAEREREKEKMR